jgi:FtsP/CotA-like multicopper oxidase with cupredoxin domain
MKTQTWKPNPTLVMMAVTAVVLVLGTAWAGHVGVTTSTPASGQHADHVAGGTAATDLKPAAASQGKVRRYYIAAEEVLWDYAPSDTNRVTGEPFTDDENVFMANGPARIGDTYRKALYRAYTDASFSTRLPADPGLGMLGPVIRAEVGDTIKVVFRNRTSIPASVHPHGVFYDKSSEGAPYADGTSGADKADDAVQPGRTVTYTWEVPERAGPGPMNGSSVMWMYHSHTDEIGDTNAGLVGPMVITGRGQAQPDGSPLDVDREVFSYFSVVDENQSQFLEQNLEELAQAPHEVSPEDEEAFEESNLMHTINGYAYGNGPTVTLHRGERVRWYLFSLGTEVDLHTPHWHGNTATVMGMRTDMAELLPGSMMAADMRPDDLGEWLFHCHVNDHIAAGMITKYRVVR